MTPKSPAVLNPPLSDSACLGSTEQKEPGIGLQCSWACFPLMLSMSWETAASMLMTDRQPSGLSSAPFLPLLPEVYPGPCRYRTATSLKSWSVHLPKHNFLSFIHSLKKYLSPACNVPDTMIPRGEKTKNGTCPHVAYSQPDIKYCWGRRNFLLLF